MKSSSLSLTAALATLATRATADNPIIQTLYTTDPAPLVYDDRIYLYTGHDEPNAQTFQMNDWRVYSSSDMVNWQDHGSPLSLKTFSWATAQAWAGQTIPRNGKFYWYVPMRHTSGSMAIGVAVGDTPTGPFKDAIGKPLVMNNGIDPTVWIDDDGQAYLYWGNPGLWYIKLNPDMVSYTGNINTVTLTAAGFGGRSGNAQRPTTFEEGPWLYKRSGKYYMVFAASCCSEHLGWSTGPSPTGPWTYGGVMMPAQGSSFTNHAGVVDFRGGSYLFYHNGALPGGGGYDRSVCVEKFAYGTNGSIPVINMSKEGAPQVGTLDPYVRQEAETMAWSSGVQTEVKGVAFGGGAKTFTARVSSGSSGGKIELRLGSASGTVVGTCNVSGTGGWQNWASVGCNVSGATGTQDVFFRFTGGGGELFRFNWWQFKQ